MDILRELIEQFKVIWSLELFKSGDPVIYMNQLVIALVVTVIGLSIAKKLSISSLTGSVRSPS